MNNVCAKPLSKKIIAKKAMDLRRILELEDQLFFPVVKFIEYYLPELGYEIDIVAVDELPNAYAITNNKDKVMKIREDVYEAAVQGNGRHRFTLCHEVGHVFLHTENNIEFARGKEIPKFRDPEWQANEFAGELMAPGALIYNIPVEIIKNECGMSEQAAKIQFDKHAV